MKPAILIVEDDKGLRKQLYWALKEEYEVIETESAIDAREKIRKKPFIKGVILDLHLPPEPDTPQEGLNFLSYLKNFHPDVGVIVITGSRTKKAPTKAVEFGVEDFFPKPFEIDELKLALKRTLHMVELKRKVREMQKQLEERYTFTNIVGKSKKMQKLFQFISKVASTNSTVLIRGESGTGKELVARAIHYNSPRKDALFVPVNCAALPETLLEAELFGHEKGAFTDAEYKKEGIFEIANKGTIFLDEISDMTLRMQAKILRVIQERTFTRLGSTKPIEVDVRILAATNKNIEEMIDEGSFREDLYYRLNVVSIEIPPLRDRKEDIPLLAQHFLKKYTSIHGKRIKGISREAMDELCSYSWPGNVRELENVVERAIILSDREVVSLEDLPPHLRSTTIQRKLPLSSIEEMEKRLILDILKVTGGNQSKAAKILGVHRNTLHRKLKKYNIDS